MTAAKPTLFLSNWSSYRSPGQHGEGRKYTIMAKPRAWEKGEGLVRALAPLEPAVAAAFEAARMARGRADEGEALARYRAALEGGWTTALKVGDLRPHPTALRGLTARSARQGPVAVVGGDTLCCACSKAEAALGRCHRVWAVPFLLMAGWDVVIDGVRAAA